MSRSFFLDTFAFFFLLIPASIIAWFHHHYFAAVLAGIRHLLDQRNPLPSGFEFLSRFGFFAYLPILFIASAAALASHFPIFRSSLCFAVLGSFLAIICILYVILISTPALSHGLYL